MNPELSKVLADLASKLGTSIEHLWPVLVAERRLNSIIAIIIGATFATLGAIFFRKGLKVQDEADRGIVLVVTAIAFIFGVCTAGGCLPSAVYPDAAVISKLLGK